MTWDASKTTPLRSVVVVEGEEPGIFTLEDLQALRAEYDLLVEARLKLVAMGVRTRAVLSEISKRINVIRPMVVVIEIPCMLCRQVVPHLVPVIGDGRATPVRALCGACANG
jgi:hypothetical protein